MEHPHNLEPHHTCQCNYYNTHTPHTGHRNTKPQSVTWPILKFMM